MTKRRLIQMGAGLACGLLAVAAGAQSQMQPSGAGMQGMQQPGAAAQSPMQQGSAGVQGMQQPSAANIPMQGQMQRIDVSQMQRGQPIQVSDEFNNRTQDGCQLRSTVNGTLQSYLPTGAAPNAPASVFVPNLQIRTNLQCQNGGRFTSSANLAGPAMSQGQLERALSQIARGVTPSGNQLCGIAAGYQFASGRLASTTLVRECVPAIGGGPASDQAPIQQPANDMGLQPGNVQPGFLGGQSGVK